MTKNCIFSIEDNVKVFFLSIRVRNSLNKYEVSVPREFDSFILACAVTDGANNGTECVFPFIYNNTKYNGCILEANSEFSFEIESWCSTEVKLSL